MSTLYSEPGEVTPRAILVSDGVQLTRVQLCGYNSSELFLKSELYLGELFLENTITREMSKTQYQNHDQNLYQGFEKDGVCKVQQF